MTAMNDKTDARSKVLLLGHPGVGKTALARSLNGADFQEPPRNGLQVVTSTIGSEQVPMASATLVDVGGEYLEEHINKAEFSVAIVLVDPLSQALRADVQYWSDLLNSSAKKFAGTKFLVLSRLDRGGLDPANEKISELAQMHGFSAVFETSAMQASGIQELRSAVLRAIPSPEEEHETAVESVVRILAHQLCELIAKDPRVLDEIEWRDLERVIAAALEAIGFDVKLTPPAKDGGKDVILRCNIENQEQVFYVEVKHWRQGGRPSWSQIADFIQVNAQDRTNGGLFLSSSGFTDRVYCRLEELSQQRIRLGKEEKIVSLCTTYVKRMNGTWKALSPLPEILFEQTLAGGTAFRASSVPQN